MNKNPRGLLQNAIFICDKCDILAFNENHENQNFLIPVCFKGM